MSDLRAYLLLTFSCSVAAAVGAMLTGGAQSELLTPIGLLIMLTQALCVPLAARLTHQPMGPRPW